MIGFPDTEVQFILYYAIHYEFSLECCAIAQ